MKKEEDGNPSRSTRVHEELEVSGGNRGEERGRMLENKKEKYRGGKGSEMGVVSFIVFRAHGGLHLVACPCEPRCFAHYALSGSNSN